MHGPFLLSRVRRFLGHSYPVHLRLRRSRSLFRTTKVARLTKRRLVVSVLRGQSFRFFIYCAARTDGQDIDRIAHEPVHDPKPADPNRVKSEQLALERLALQRFEEKSIDGRPDLALEVGMQLSNSITDFV